MISKIVARYDPLDIGIVAMKTNLVKILSWICTREFSNNCRRDFDVLCNNIVLLFSLYTVCTWVAATVL